jgi:hypothetical protein
LNPTDARDEIDPSQAYQFLMLAEGAIHAILRSAKVQIARSELASSYASVGRAQEEAAVRRHIVASWNRVAGQRERELGQVHADTVAARERLAYSYRGVGRYHDEVAIIEQIAADDERLLGPRHPRTLRAQVRLAISYWEGDFAVAKAIELGERIVADVDKVSRP